MEFDLDTNLNDNNGIKINKNNDKKIRDTIKGYIEDGDNEPSTDLEYITD